MRTFEEDDSDPSGKQLAIEKRKSNLEKNIVIGLVVLFIPLWFFVIRYETSKWI